MKVLLTEFIGTFFLVLTIGLAVASGSDLAPLAIGAGLMVMVYMGGHTSGAHYNPAVSLAAMMRGALPQKQFLPYVATQVAAAIVAAYVSSLLVGSTFQVKPGSAGTGAAVIAEVLYTFALALVVLNVAVSKKTKGNSYYGLAIGMAVMVGAITVGGISGGAFNPAVAIGAIVIDAALQAGPWQHIWIYLVGPFVGAALAAAVFGIQESERS